MVKYRYSLKFIISFIGFGLFFTLAFLPTFHSDPFFCLLSIIICSLPLYICSYYLYRARKLGQGYYFDDEGITIDLKETKVYWHEIEDIQFMKYQGYKSTIIYPHYTYHEKIRMRRGKKLPTTSHSIDWIMIERPKIYHKQLLLAWTKWKENNSK